MLGRPSGPTVFRRFLGGKGACPTLKNKSLGISGKGHIVMSVPGAGTRGARAECVRRTLGGRRVAIGLKQKRLEIVDVWGSKRPPASLKITGKVGGFALPFFSCVVWVAGGRLDPPQNKNS